MTFKVAKLIDFLLKNDRKIGSLFFLKKMSFLKTEEKQHISFKETPLQEMEE